MDYFVKRDTANLPSVVVRRDGDAYAVLSRDGWVDRPELLVKLQEPDYDPATVTEARAAATTLGLDWPVQQRGNRPEIRRLVAQGLTEEQARDVVAAPLDVPIDALTGRPITGTPRRPSEPDAAAAEALGGYVDVDETGAFLDADDIRYSDGVPLFADEKPKRRRSG